MSMNVATPIRADDYQGVADLLRHAAMASKSVQTILTADPKFAAWFKRQGK